MKVSNLTTQELVARTQNALIHELDGIFSALTLVDIGIVAEALEERLRRFLEETIVAQPWAFIQHATNTESQVARIKVGDAFIELIVYSEPLNPNSLLIAFLPRGSELVGSKRVREKARIDGVGRFEKLTVVFPQDLQLDIERILTLSKAVIESGYEWLERQVLAVISDEAIAASGIYGYVATIVRDRKVLQDLWFSAINRDTGIYLLDRDQIQVSVRRVQPNAKNWDVSPFSLVAELWTTLIPFDLLDAKIAVESGKSIDVNFKKAKYLNTESLLAEAEVSVFNTEAYTICPIAEAGETHLCAVFPSVRKAELQDLLMVYHREALAERFQHFQSRLRRLAKLLTRPRSSVSPSVLGEFAGSAVAAFLKISSSP